MPEINEIGKRMHSGEKKKKDRKYSLLILLICILLAFNVFLLFQFIQKKGQKEFVEQELVSTLELKEELEKEIEDYEAKMEEYEAYIDEKDSIILAGKKEIEEKVDEIRSLIRQGNISRKKFKEAQDELDRLRYYIQKYQKQIDALTRENRKLTQQNTELVQDIRGRKKEIDHLKDENVSLSNRLNLGAKLNTRTLEVNGIQERNAGKINYTFRGRKMEGVHISFSLEENIIAKRGEKKIFIKILSPRGETLYIENSGSGKFEYLGDESLYTVMKVIDYKNEPQTLYEAYWYKGSPFEKGTYKVQLFESEQKIGETTFTVK
jgi:uncharacterized protein YoxC